MLVTGGAGFIGSHVVDTLVKAGRRVRVIDRLHPSAHRGQPNYLNPSAEYGFADLRDLGAAERSVRGTTAVCHLASMVGLGRDFSDVGAYVADNDAATANLLLALYRTGFSGRLVLGSSMVVYGEGRYSCPRHGVVRPRPRDEPDLAAGRFDTRCPSCAADLVPRSVPEDAPVDPRSVYGATKLHQEHLCAAYAREHGVPLAVLRFHNVYGPRMPRDTPYAGVASIFRSALERGEPPRVFEDGRQLRDFIHVADVAHAVVLALDPQAPAGTWNVATGNPRSIGDVAAALTAAFPRSPAPVITGGYRLGDVRHVFASADRAREELGFLARMELEEGLSEFARAPLRGTGDPMTVEGRVRAEN